ncbi:citrate/2-methylcitrate synthase [Ornithinimicrobium sp. Y1694]|uniref:citrate/2-methylcitrate synthase n=1 Tax=Ornithinimicrobium sp. Y1694 TaxID=3418590 RepID=UPI003CE989BA
MKVQTVYAYVSRGVLTPVRRDPELGSLFALEDVRAVGERGRSSRRGRAASDDVRTQITEVTAGELSYRGYAVSQLVRTRSVEEVRRLLVGGRGDEPGRSTSRGLDPQREWPGADERAALAAVIDALPPGSSTLDRFKHAVLVAGATDVGRQDRSAAAFARAGERAVRFMTLALSPGGVPAERSKGNDGSLAAALADAVGGCPVEVVEAVLVLLADHDLAVSTTAVRVAVSSGADPYGALLAGLAAADSPHHMAAPSRALDWLEAALRDPRAAIDTALAGGKPVGFGHVVYTEQDPRAQVLLELLEPFADAEALVALRLVERELVDRRGWVLTVDTSLALLMQTFGLPRDAGTALFACARTAGWTAHAIEELAEPGMRFRLKGVYTAPR